MTKELSKFFKKLGKNTIKILNKYWDDELGAFHLNKVHDLIIESEEEYRNILYKYAKKEYDKSRKATQRRYKQQLKKISIKSDINIDYLESLFQPNKKITSTLENKVFLSARSTMDRVDNKINKVISEGYYEGLGVKAVGDRLTKEYSSLSSWEANRIARTEINCASNDAAFDEYYDNDVEFQQWWTGQDERVRTSHQDLHGKIVRVGSKFSNGLLYPGDRSGMVKEWINCRCTTVPFLMPLGKMAPPGMVEFTESDLVDIPSYHPISVEDALNTNYPLEYWTNGGVFDQAKTVQSPMIELTDVFKTELRGVVDDADLDHISKELARFNLSTKDLRYERLSVWDSNGKSLMEFHTNFTEDMVYFPPSIGQIGDTKGFKFSSHNHTKGFASLPSTSDILQMTRSEYGFNTSYDDGLAVLTHKKGYFKGNIDSLKKDLDDFDNYLWDLFGDYDDRYLNNLSILKMTKKITDEQLEILKSYRFNRFIKQNESKFYTDLNNVLRKYDMEVKHIPQSRLPNNKYVSKGIREVKLDIDRVPDYDYNNAYMGRTGKVYENLTADEALEYEELLLKQKTEKLKFKERKLLKKLEQKINSSDIEELPEALEYKQKSIVFSDEDDALQVLLINKKRTASLTEKEKELDTFLKDKQRFKPVASKIEKGEKLDVVDTDRYFEYYRKYGEKQNVPKLEGSKLTVQQSSETEMKIFHNEITLDELSSKFALSKKQNKELEELRLKSGFGKKLTSKEIKKLEEFELQLDFNTLYSLRIKNNGLNWEDTKKYRKLYNQLKTKLKLTDDLLDDLIEPVKSDIPLGKITSKTKLKKFKGTREDGLLPGNEDLSEYFTKDAREMSPREQQVAERWLGPDYKDFTQYELSGRNKEEFAKYILESSDDHWKDINSMERALKHADEIAHDTRVLDNILNNQLKKPMTVWRVQEDHFLGVNPKVGDIIDFPNFRSTAISKEGALFFSETNSKPMKYIIEIELPEGTRGAYLAPIKKGEIINPNSKFIGKKYANEMEFLLKESKVEIVKFEDKTMKGGLGEDLIHVKLKVVGNKNNSSNFIKYSTSDKKHTINIREVSDPKEFKKSLELAAKTQPDNKSWRVDLTYDLKDYEGCKLYVTENGSTVAIKPDGDIVSVCAKIKPDGTNDSTRALLEFAVENGGTKFDSYDGNYGVYRYCGFEPVSWCKFDEQYAPELWKELKNKGENINEEDIIFFKYTGKQSEYIDKNSFYDDVDASENYDAAEKIRDEVLK